MWHVVGRAGTPGEASEAFGSGVKCKWAAKKLSKQVNKMSELHVKTGWHSFHDPALLCSLFQGTMPSVPCRVGYGG